MVAPKRKRTDLEVPAFVRDQWNKGTQAKEELAAALQEANWDKAGTITDKTNVSQIFSSGVAKNQIIRSANG